MSALRAYQQAAKEAPSSVEAKVAVTVPAALTAVFAALLLVVIVRNQGNLVRPQLARA